jgi:hypothetical protein
MKKLYWIEFAEEAGRLDGLAVLDDAADLKRQALGWAQAEYEDPDFEPDFALPDIKAIYGGPTYLHDGTGNKFRMFFEFMKEANQGPQR